MPFLEPALLQLATNTVAEALKKGGSLSELVSDTTPNTIADAKELAALDPDQRAVAALTILAEAAKGNDKHQRDMFRLTLASVVVAALGVAVAIVAIVFGAGD